MRPSAPSTPACTGLLRRGHALKQAHAGVLRDRAYLAPYPPQEARARIAAAGALGRALGYLSPSAPLRLQSCALRLLTNLALERKLRAAAVRGGLVQRLAHMLAASSSGNSSSLDSSSDGSVGGGRSSVPAQLQSLVYGCLYLASMEPAGRHALASGELVPRWAGRRVGSSCVGLCMTRRARRASHTGQCSAARSLGTTSRRACRLIEGVLQARDLRATPELIATVVNLAGEPAATEVRAGVKSKQRSAECSWPP